MRRSVTDRFLQYVRVPSASDPFSESSPSTPEQYAFGELLQKELLTLGLEDVYLSPEGHLTATLPGTNKEAPVIGFIAHMDTSPEVSGNDVSPQIIRNYQGEFIPFVSDDSSGLDPKEFPELLDYKGQDLIVTDGTTLLGADDKAGVAAIITLMEELITRKPFPHGKIRIAFTPDEEIGRGTDYFDVPAFGADFAYTVDGGPLGELQYENFNAASLCVTLAGRNTHPGTARGKMVNALTLARHYADLLPAGEVPENTMEYEGFFHLLSFEGTVEKAELRYLLRDFTASGLERRKNLARKGAELLNATWGNRITLEFEESYRNMREKIEEAFEAVELASQAMKACNISPRNIPIRGGTDGARLSWEGLPTPNLFTGGHNFHSRYEFLPISSLEQCFRTLKKIVELGNALTSSKKVSRS